MTEERYKQLMEDDKAKLTDQEVADGWHYCYEFDGLLVGPGMGELRFCACWPKDHPVYSSQPPQGDEPTEAL